MLIVFCTVGISPFQCNTDILVPKPEVSNKASSLGQAEKSKEATSYCTWNGDESGRVEYWHYNRAQRRYN